MNMDVYDKFPAHARAFEVLHWWIWMGYCWCATPAMEKLILSKVPTQDESERQSRGLIRIVIHQLMKIWQLMITDEPGTESTRRKSSWYRQLSGEIHIYPASTDWLHVQQCWRFIILTAMAAIRIVSRIHLLRSSSVGWSKSLWKCILILVLLLLYSLGI